MSGSLNNEENSSNSQYLLKQSYSIKSAIFLNLAFIKNTRRCLSKYSN